MVPIQAEWKLVSRAADGKRIWRDETLVADRRESGEIIYFKTLWTDILGGHANWFSSNHGCEGFRPGIPSVAFTLPTRTNYRELMFHGGRGVFSRSGTTLEPVYGVAPFYDMENDTQNQRLHNISSHIFGGGEYLPLRGSPTHYEAIAYLPFAEILPPTRDAYLNIHFNDSTAFFNLEVTTWGSALHSNPRLDFRHAGYRCAAMVRQLEDRG